ncbi:protein translocase subunit SecF [Alkalimonas collagenimarina]|uniref:Protein-export membrane protein SecF n=1 Tax=Alkalimonas collagenimarina TaxID=400390 RepID=A0ABT9GWR8_9GAMM|nr:protein translocase subunit SecF [Alkalimonas collagenimarina]MDP4535468.1 protein translocase subunit SecF [Alkalimonas collagenimarina]
MIGFNFQTTINFMKLKIPALILSSILIVASLGLITTKGLNWGLDFTGGTVIEVGYQRDADLSAIRSVLADEGFPDAVVQYFGSSQEVLIRIGPRDDIEQVTLGEQILSLLDQQDADTVDMRRIEFVGPSVGAELKEQGGLATLAALICIMIYVAFRFEWRFALGAVAALAHDVILTVGLFSLLGLEFDLTVLAAVLAVIGYSLNDTIVVCDRIREGFLRIRESSPIEVVNESLTGTLSRTFITSLTTILVLLVLFFKGGALIHGFATALLFGVVIGTYSSVYIASSTSLLLGISREDLMPPPVEKEGENTEPLI